MHRTAFRRWHDRYLIQHLYVIDAVTCSYEPAHTVTITIRLQVDAFYARVRRDAVLGPVFADAIATAPGPRISRKCTPSGRP